MILNSFAKCMNRGNSPNTFVGPHTWLQLRVSLVPFASIRFWTLVLWDEFRLRQSSTMKAAFASWLNWFLVAAFSCRRGLCSKLAPSWKSDGAWPVDFASTGVPFSTMLLSSMGPWLTALAHYYGMCVSSKSMHKAYLMCAIGLVCVQKAEAGLLARLVFLLSSNLQDRYCPYCTVLELVC